MNALTVQNPRHKCDFGNNLRTIFDCNNNYYIYYIIFVSVCITTHTPSPTSYIYSIRLQEQCQT